MINVQRKENIIQDLYTLECHLCDKLNDRAHRKKIYTGGIFSPSTMADWGDKVTRIFDVLNKYKFDGINFDSTYVLLLPCRKIEIKE